MSGCDPGRAVAVHRRARGRRHPARLGHDPAHVTARRRRPDRLAVTKALTAIDPDHPELRAARELGIPVEPWQQVVADAAASRTLVAVAGTHGKSTTAGWLVHVLVAAGRDPSAFVGALLPPALTGGVAGDGASGSGADVRRRGRRVRRQLRPVPARRSRSSHAEWDHPDVFADADAVLRRVRRRGSARRAGRAATARRQRRRCRASRPSSSAWRDAWHVVAALAPVDGSADWRASARDGRRPASAVGRIVAERPGRDDARDRRPRRRWRTARDPAADRGPAQRRERARCRRGGAGARRRRRRRSAAAWRRSRASAGGWSSRARPAASSCYDDYGHHPTAIRATLAAVRQREPGRRVWAVYEPLTYHRTAAMLDDVRRRRSRRPTPSPSPTSGPAATPTRRSPGARRWPTAVAARRPEHPGRGAGLGRGDGGLAGRRGPSRRRRAGHGRRPELPDRRAACCERLGRRTRARRWTSTHAAGERPARALRARLGDVRRRRLDRAVHRGRRVSRGPVRAAAGRPQCDPRVLARGVRATGARRVHGRAPLGRRLRRCSPRWHASYIRRPIGHGSGSPAS